MKKVRGIAAFAAAVMALNSATVVFAAGGETEREFGGTGRVEGIVSLAENVFLIDLPTEEEAEDNTSFDFILDPQNLIYRTKDAASKHYTQSFDFDNSHGLYFPRTTGAYEYSGTSDEIKATNNGTSQVKVSVDVTLNNADDITLYSKDSSFTSWDDINDAGMYISVHDTADTPDGAPLDNTTKNAKIGTTLDGAEVEEGDVSYNTETGEYSLSAGATTGVDYSFYLTGEAGGKWTESTTVPSLSLVWKFKQVVENIEPSAPETYELSSSAEDGTTIEVDFGDGDYEATAIDHLTISSTAWAAFNGKTDEELGNTYVTINGNDITFTKAFAEKLKGRGGVTSAEIVFDNEIATTKTITFTIN